MPVTDEAQLPIGRLKVSGPAVKALAERREVNNRPAVTAAELRSNYDSVKNELFSGFKVLAGAEIKR